MKKSRILLSTMIIIMGITNAIQAQFRKGTNPVKNASLSFDTTQSIPLSQLLSPYFQTFTFTESNFEDKSSNNNIIQFSKPAKLLLGLGADLIRGGTDDVPLYSFENAWKYPGPTVRYSETAAEFELFLERYQRYTSDH